MELWGLLIWASFLLLSVAVISLLLYCGYIQYIHMKYDHIPGPPRDSFLFGHMPSILRVTENNNLVDDLFLEWAKLYGPVMRINILHHLKILLTSPEGVKEVLMSPEHSKDAAYNRAATLFGVRLMGNGLVTDQDNDHWRKQRSMIDPAFSRKYLNGLMGLFNEKTEELMEKLSKNVGCEIKMHDLMSRLTLDVIAKTAFGLEINSLKDDQAPLPQAILLVMKGLAESMNPFAKFIPWKQSFIQDVQKRARLLRQTGRECIEKRQKEMQNGDNIPEDILTQILRAADLEGDYDPESLVDNFVTVLIGGQETTANHICFALMELAKNVEILAKVQAEVNKVIGSKKHIEHDDLRKLCYLSQVLKEALRLYPTVPGTSRAIKKEIIIERVRIPPNVTAVFNSYIMGRMDQFYQDPLTFIPERFSPDSAK
ncbi:cholesterol 24-hydroxylase-like [Pelobates cultripes]|nr:cholesterol 24-hydroxylase-like [Pelobates cultripes]